MPPNQNGFLSSRLLVKPNKPIELFGLPVLIRFGLLNTPTSLNCSERVLRRYLNSFKWRVLDNQKPGRDNPKKRYSHQRVDSKRLDDYTITYTASACRVVRSH